MKVAYGNFSIPMSPPMSIIQPLPSGAKIVSVRGTVVHYEYNPEIDGMTDRTFHIFSEDFPFQNPYSPDGDDFLFQNPYSPDGDDSDAESEPKKLEYVGEFEHNNIWRYVFEQID